jgi:FtsZ-interacting cell division protein ZipA
MASMLVGLFDGPDDLRDALMVVGFAALVVFVVMAVSARRRRASP